MQRFDKDFPILVNGLRFTHFVLTPSIWCGFFFSGLSALRIFVCPTSFPSGTCIPVQVLHGTQCGAVKAAASPWTATSLLAQRRASEGQQHWSSSAYIPEVFKWNTVEQVLSHKQTRMEPWDSPSWPFTAIKKNKIVTNNSSPTFPSSLFSFPSPLSLPLSEG